MDHLQPTLALPWHQDSDDEHMEKWEEQLIAMEEPRLRIPYRWSKSSLNSWLTMVKLPLVNNGQQLNSQYWVLVLVNQVVDLARINEPSR